MKGKSDGNVVLGLMTDGILMLDCDKQREEDVINFAREYSKFHNLGSFAVFLTSKASIPNYIMPNLWRVNGVLNNYFIIFGRLLAWQEVRWHVKEAYRLGIVNKDFLVMRNFEAITARYNAKNRDKPHPKLVYFEDDRRSSESRFGIWRYLEFFGRNKNVG